jgi:flagellar hook-length control protein FliK
MLEAVAAPPPKPAAHAAQASSARSVEAEDTGFQVMLREALELPAESGWAQNNQAVLKTAVPMGDGKPEANGAKAQEGITGIDAAGLFPQATVALPVEPSPAALEAIAQPALLTVDSAVATALPDQALVQVAAPPGYAPTELAGLPLASAIILEQPLAQQPGLQLQDGILGDTSRTLPAASPITAGPVATLSQSDKGAEMGAILARNTPNTENVAAAPLSSQTTVMGAVATNNAAQLLEGSSTPGGEGTAPTAPALVTKGMLTAEQMPPAKALQDTLATALATGPAQSAVVGAALKPQAAGYASKREAISPAEAALAATRPAEAASLLARAFNATEAAAEMKLVMASETAEVGLNLASIEAPKNVGAKPSGEVRAEAAPIAAYGFAPTDGMAQRTEAALPSAQARELPAPVPARQLAPVVVSLALGRGDEALTIALDPVELGRVEVSIGQGKEAGQIRIVAERPETLALLQRDQRELDRALNQSGLGDMARSLSFSLASDQGRQQQQGSTHGRGQHASMTIGGVTADQAMSALPALHRNPNALIDIAV